MMSPLGKILVIGGTGVSGIPLVTKLVQRGYEVTLFHSGKHKPSIEVAPWYYDGSIVIVLGNAFKRGGFRQTLIEHCGSQGDEKVSFDIVCSMYGNLASIADLFGHDLYFSCKKFISIGGIPLYDHYTGSNVLRHIMDEDFPILTTTGDLAGKPCSDNPKINKIIEAEQLLFKAIPTATHFRYPVMYGPYQIIPEEYMIVRRVLEGRNAIILPENIQYLPRNVCYGPNAADALIKVIESFLDSSKNQQRDISAGQIYLMADDAQVNIGQWIRIICQTLKCEDYSLIEMPYELARPAFPITREGLGKSACVLSNRKFRNDFNFNQSIEPRIAIRDTALWLKKQIESGSINHTQLEQLLQDPFDYDAEDQLISLWNNKDYQGCLDVKFKAEPGFGHFYYGRLVNPRDRLTQNQRHAGEYDPLQVKRVKSKL